MVVAQRSGRQGAPHGTAEAAVADRQVGQAAGAEGTDRAAPRRAAVAGAVGPQHLQLADRRSEDRELQILRRPRRAGAAVLHRALRQGLRSEENTSDLQSLMRTQYA